MTQLKLEVKCIFVQISCLKTQCLSAKWNVDQKVVHVMSVSQNVCPRTVKKKICYYTRQFELLSFKFQLTKPTAYHPAMNMIISS